MQLEHTRNELQLKFNLNHHNMVRLNCAAPLTCSQNCRAHCTRSYIRFLCSTFKRHSVALFILNIYTYTEFVFIHVGAHAHAGVPASEVNLNTRRKKMYFRKCLKLGNVGKLSGF